MKEVIWTTNTIAAGINLIETGGAKKFHGDKITGDNY